MGWRGGCGADGELHRATLDLVASRETISVAALLEVLEKGLLTGPQQRRITLIIYESLRASGEVEEGERFARAHDLSLREGGDPWPSTPVEAPAPFCSRPLSNREATAGFEREQAALEPIDDCIESFKSEDPSRTPMMLVTKLTAPDGTSASVEVKGVHADPAMMDCALQAALQVRVEAIEHGFRVTNWMFVPG